MSNPVPGEGDVMGALYLTDADLRVWAEQHRHDPSSLTAMVAQSVLRLLADRDDEREKCVALIRYYLSFDSQRAVSWHEVQDGFAYKPVHCPEVYGQRG